MSDIEKIHGITPDPTRENVDRLLALFPDVATETTDPKTGRTERAVDFDALRERLGDVAEGNRERYQFTWPGKREAKRLAREPIAKDHSMRVEAYNPEFAAERIAVSTTKFITSPAKGRPMELNTSTKGLSSTPASCQGISEAMTTMER